MDLSGKWLGHYFYQWVTGEPAAMDERTRWAFPIEATFLQSGNQLTGSMIDLRRDYEMSGQEMYGYLKSSLSVAERIKVKWSLLCYPHFVSHIRLPEHSQLLGEVNGDVVAFAKTYQGMTETRLLNASNNRVMQSQSDTVHYLGSISSDESMIEGAFSFTTALDPSLVSKGNFRLIRQ